MPPLWSDTAPPPAPRPSTPAVVPSTATPRLLSALVDRWVRQVPRPGGDPRLSVWAYDDDSARLRGMWSASARVVGCLDPWLRTDLVRRLSGARPGGPDRPQLLLAWERPGPVKLRAGDLAWYAAWRARSMDGLAERAGDDRIVVVTRAGWLSVPDGAVGRRHRTAHP